LLSIKTKQRLIGLQIESKKNRHSLNSWY